MEPNYNNELLENKKSNTGLIVIIILLSIAVICLSGYIIYDKVLNKPEVKEEQKNEEPKNEEKPKEDEPIVEIPTLEKEEVLEKMFGNLFYELKLDTGDNNLLTNESNKYHLVKTLIQQYKPEDVLYDSEVHNDVVGFFYIEESIYDNYYKEVIGKEFINSSTRVMTYDEIESYAKENNLEFNSNLINKDKRYYQITIITGYPNYLDSTKIIENKIDENNNVIITIEYSSENVLTKLHITITNKVYNITVEQ